MDIIEISIPMARCSRFPADMKSPETGIRYRDMYPGKYRRSRTASPIRPALLSLSRRSPSVRPSSTACAKAPDDERVQENLGYGEMARPRPASS
jgi:hypothetical protein